MVYINIDGHESKPAVSILAIVQESRKTSAFHYFITDSLDKHYCSYMLMTLVNTIFLARGL